MSDCTPNLATIESAYVNWALLADRGIDASEAAAEFDRFIADVKADAWDEGLRAGWEECQNPDPFVNDWWDSKAPNPHRIEEEA